jgi:hypothetical protein
MGEWRYSSTSFDLGTRRRLVNRFTPRPLYPGGKSPPLQLYRRLSGLHSRSGGCEEEKHLYIELIKQIPYEGVHMIQLAQGMVQWWFL